MECNGVIGKDCGSCNVKDCPIGWSDEVYSAHKELRDDKNDLLQRIKWNDEELQIHQQVRRQLEDPAKKQMIHSQIMANDYYPHEKPHIDRVFVRDVCNIDAERLRKERKDLKDEMRSIRRRENELSKIRSGN